MNALGHPSTALLIARQEINDRVRDAEARRTAREVRQAARSAAATRSDRPRRRIRVRLRARA
jgi:hypothetical protein